MAADLQQDLRLLPVEIIFICLAAVLSNRGKTAKAKSGRGVSRI
jgi:hypothetical protein